MGTKKLAKLGTLVLGVYLILVGLQVFIPALGPLAPLVALIAGVLMLLGR